MKNGKTRSFLNDPLPGAQITVEQLHVSLGLPRTAFQQVVQFTFLAEEDLQREHGEFMI